MITERDKRLGKRIQKLRKHLGLKQFELAEKTGLSTKFIQYIEVGRRKPALKTLYKIARILKIKVKDIFPF